MLAEVTADSSPETVESWDSVQHLNLILAIEEEYGFQFSPEEMDGAKTVGAIAGLVAATARRLMALEILPYTADRIAAVRAFNRTAGGARRSRRSAISRDTRPGMDAGNGTLRRGGRRHGARRLHSAAAAISGGRETVAGGALPAAAFRRA